MSQPEKPPAPIPIYFCTDIETSGQCYATGSMMTIGTVPVAHIHGKFQICGDSFYMRLHPRQNSDRETMDWWKSQNKDVYSETFGMGNDNSPVRRSPYSTMELFAAYIKRTQKQFAPGVETEPICVAGPVAFDGNFIKNYFINYLGSDPFGHNRYVDLKSYVMGVTGMEHSQVTRECISDEMYQYLLKDFEHKNHTYPKHHSLGDASELAKLWCAILTDNKQRVG